MQHILRMSLLLMILFNFMWAFEVKDDREISVRKEIDSFARVEQKEVPTVDKFKKMFTDGKVTGQVRSMYVGYNYEQAGLSNTYATALGGMLKYELASLNGFNAGVSFITSHDISFVSGNKNSYKHNSELSSQSGHYVEASEAYINYRNGGFNFRAGRQTFDTPLADSDDVRMIPNTFEAYLVTYEIEDFICTVGNVQKWQGFGTGLGYDANGMKRDSNWIDIGHGGTWFGGINYTGPVEINAWYYDIPKPKHATKASYFDIGSHTSEGMITIHG